MATTDYLAALIGLASGEHHFSFVRLLGLIGCALFIAVVALIVSAWAGNLPAKKTPADELHDKNAQAKRKGDLGR